MPRRPECLSRAGVPGLLAGLSLGLLSATPLGATDWVRAGLTTNQPVWGVRTGLQFALPPGGFRGRDGGPRGLIRLGYPILPHGGYDLVNFIAVEPVVRGRRGFSELEPSRLDGVTGKRFRAETPGASAEDATPTPLALAPGRLTREAHGRERLEVVLRIEPFDHGAHVRLLLAQASDRPDELELQVFTEPDSAPVEYCFLTATMGNMARTRRLWLKDGGVSSLGLYPEYRGADFAPHTIFGRDRLLETAPGEVWVAITTDEAEPATVEPFPGTRHWYYGGFPVTQYWRTPAGAARADLHVAVNARYTYWRSRQPIPGGIAFENFELRERFHEGQRFVFGLTRRTPGDLGFRRPEAVHREGPAAAMSNP